MGLYATSYPSLVEGLCKILTPKYFWPVFTFRLTGSPQIELQVLAMRNQLHELRK